MESTKGAVLAQLLLMVVLLTGCAPWSSGISSIENFATDYRDLVRGLTAYARIHGNSKSHPFKCGFIEGYHNVLAGGNGCPPPIPPKKYWLRYNRLANGQQHISEWFEGFADGAAAAKSDGYSRFGQYPVSPLYQNVRMPYETVYDQQNRLGLLQEESYEANSILIESPNLDFPYASETDVPLSHSALPSNNKTIPEPLKQNQQSTALESASSREFNERNAVMERKPTVLLVPKEKNMMTVKNDHGNQTSIVKSVKDWFKSSNTSTDANQIKAAFSKN